MKSNIGLVFCVEKGLLEEQAKLFVSSVKRLISNDLNIIAFSPRKDFYPSKDTEIFFSQNNVLHIKENINTKYLDYPIANKLLACDYVEKNFSDYNSIIFVDTDTLFLNPIHATFFSNDSKLYLRPVDNKGPGSEGASDKNDFFWKEVFDLFNLVSPTANTTTTVRQHIIKPYYNAGFIWAHKLPGFFQQWKKDFQVLFNSNLRPYGYSSRENTDFRCLDQVALAVTAQRYKEYVEILPQTYNYPIPFRPMMRDRPEHPKFDELVHVHYHKWFQHPGFLDYVTTEEEKKTEQYLWLKEHLPLLPTIDGPFKC